jgi:hypothetical protein
MFSCLHLKESDESNSENICTDDGVTQLIVVVTVLDIIELVMPDMPLYDSSHIQHISEVLLYNVSHSFS